MIKFNLKLCSKVKIESIYLIESFGDRLFMEILDHRPNHGLLVFFGRGKLAFKKTESSKSSSFEGCLGIIDN